MVVDAGGRRECECGCGEAVPESASPGGDRRFVDDAHRQRAHRDRQARREAIELWDMLQIVHERPGLRALAALPASARASLAVSLKEALNAERDADVSRPLAMVTAEIVEELGAKFSYGARRP